MNDNKIFDALKEISIVDYAAFLGYTPIKKGNRYYSLKEHDSLMIDTRKNTFRRYSTDEHGDIIDFAVAMQQISKGEAVKQLKVYAGLSDKDLKDYIPRKISTAQNQEPPKEFILPQKHTGSYKRLFASLCGSRKISQTVVQDLIRRKMLYESEEKHNAVFVGFDYEKNPVYAQMKGTSSTAPFAIDVPGSQKCPYALFVDNRSSSMVVTEAAIDAMSVMTIAELNGADYKAHSYLSLQGNNIAAFKFHFEHNPQISQVVFAVDNDPTGDKYREQLRQVISESGRSVRIIDRRPQTKDFNEDLQAGVYKKIEHEKTYGDRKFSDKKSEKEDEI